MSSHKTLTQENPPKLLSQVAVVSTERQFDSHYLEEHLDLDLKEQQRKSTNKTNGYARIPTHEAALVDHCRCLELCKSTTSKTN